MAACVEGYGLTFGAMIEGLLDAGGVELLLVGFGKRGVEFGADRRDDGLGDGAGVLSVDGSGKGCCGEEEG